MLKTTTPVCFCIFLAFGAAAQKVENVNATLEGEKVSITYDLNYDDPTQPFKVALYSSHDNYTQPLSFLSGDYGDHVVPGKARRVVWDVKNALPPNFDSEINIKIRITKTEPEVAKISVRPLDRSIYKKGSTIEMHWSGGRPGEKLTIELLKNNVVRNKIAENVSNTHRYSWIMPKKSKAGKGYSLRVTHASKPTEFTDSQVFAIRPAFPLLAKTLPVIGAAAIFLWPKPPPDDVLPGPIRPD